MTRRECGILPHVETLEGLRKIRLNEGVGRQAQLTRSVDILEVNCTLLEVK
jgi:hypothetical protein